MGRNPARILKRRVSEERMNPAPFPSNQHSAKERLASAPKLSPGPGFNHRLESLRGLAAMMVAFGHAFLVADAIPNPGAFYLFNGHAAVRLFFVLSGYVLGLSLARMNGNVLLDLLAFTVRRMFRIYPAFICATLLVALGLALLPTRYGSPSGSPWFNQFYHDPVSLIMVRDNLSFRSASLNCVTWTLQVEIVGSLVLAVVHFAARTWPIAAKAALLVGGIAWAWACPAGSVIPYLFMFYVGYLLTWVGPSLAALVARWQFPRWIGPGALLLASVIFLRSRQTRVALWGEPGAAAVVLLCLVYGRPLQIYKALDLSWVRFYGRISYSFYLLHFPVLYVTTLSGFRTMPLEIFRRFPNVSALALALVSVVAATPIAWLMYVGVEKSGIALSKRLCGILSGRNKRQDRNLDLGLSRRRELSAAPAASPLLQPSGQHTSWEGPAEKFASNNEAETDSLPAPAPELEETEAVYPAASASP
jgi:peptidoglycan/LPS O-acetylase OafA/YrhL